MTEEVKKPGFISRLFGYNPEETRRKTEAAKRATEELKTIRAGLQRRIGANSEQYRADREVQAELDRAREQPARMPKRLDTTTDYDAITKAAMNSGNENTADIHNRTTIHKWDDGHGNIIYLSPSVQMDQVQAVSARITEQQKSFGTLGTAEQVKIRATTNNPYQDFLQSEALGKRFQELKQSQPGPK